MEVEAIIEVPRGSRNKYEADHDTGRIWLDRMLFTATQYPTDYGFIPATLADDGDPLDIMVLLDEPTFPGCHVLARPVAVLRMRDEAGGDDKILSVPATDPRWSHLLDITDIASFLLDEILHFFQVYKQLEPGKLTEPGHWEDRVAAEATIETAFDAFVPHRDR
ncbi:MAG TPA: inorganic diphosphatase [Acidimicrobiia bacterium]